MIDESIGFTTVDCSLGCLLVAATGRGVCHVAFGDDPAALAASLAERFPFATARRDEVGLKRFADRLLAYVEGHRDRLELPLDVSGTRFQRAVWDALRRIPRGATRSYAEVARAIGQPGAARAVARACADNPVAVAIPCHRVVRSDGAGTGYAWGAARKRTLLEREGVRLSPRGS